LKLKKLIVIETSGVIVAIVLIAVFVGITPYLASSGQNGQIGVFNQREYARETVTLQSGQRASSQFNYSTYDPAILVVDLKFQNWQKPGPLSMYCNNILVATFDATPSNPNVELTAITFSGIDLVKPPSSKLLMSSYNPFPFGNEIYFLSPEENGFEGTFSYQISIRGSR
jgi:hypothetical protein